MTAPRVAVIHYWVVWQRGGEKVAFEIARAFPEADVYFLHYDPAEIPPDIAPRVRGTSFLQHIPARRNTYRAMLPLLPLAADRLKLDGYDLLISSSAGWTHGVNASGARHLCYMHSPPRYIWDEAAPTRSSRLLRPLASPLFAALRRWDTRAANRVDRFVANSRISAGRIRSCYGREAHVIHPPAEVERFSALRRDPSGHLLAIGELVPYKRFDLAVAAAVRAKVPLVVVGDGPERARLERMATGSAVRFAGRVPDDELLSLMSSARALIHPGVEDFGIVMVEALAAGLPVIAAPAGGSQEIVTPETGVLAEVLTAEAYADAIARLSRETFADADLRDRAAAFNVSRFREEIVSAGLSLLGGENRAQGGAAG